MGNGTDADPKAIEDDEGGSHDGKPFGRIGLLVGILGQPHFNDHREGEEEGVDQDHRQHDAARDTEGFNLGKA